MDLVNPHPGNVTSQSCTKELHADAPPQILYSGHNLQNGRPRKQRRFQRRRDPDSTLKTDQDQVGTLQTLKGHV